MGKSLRTVLLGALQFAEGRAPGNEHTWLSGCGLPKIGSTSMGLVKSAEATELSLIPRGSPCNLQPGGLPAFLRGLSPLDSSQESYSSFCAKNLPPSGSSPPLLPSHQSHKRPHWPPFFWDNPTRVPVRVMWDPLVCTSSLGVPCVVLHSQTCPVPSPQVRPDVLIMHCSPPRAWGR